MQTKQIVRSVFDSISLILGEIISVGSSYADSNLAKQVMLTYATVRGRLVSSMKMLKNLDLQFNSEITTLFKNYDEVCPKSLADS